MKQLLKLGLIFSISSSGLLFTACEDGDPGPTGAQGEEGDKGDTGDTGATGEGFDDLVQYGNIVMRYKGTRTDNVAFDKTADFKFCSTGPELSWTSSVSNYDEGEGGTGLQFSVYRYNAPVVNWENGRPAYVEFQFKKPDENRDEYIYLQSLLTVTSDDLKSFPLSVDYTNTLSEAVTEYTFSSVTGELKFKYHVVVPAEYKGNETNHELEISGDVNIKVVQSLDSPR